MYKYVFTLVLVTMLSFLGCGGGGSSDNNNNNNGGNVVIDSKQKATNALVVVGSFMESSIEGLDDDVDVFGNDGKVAISFPVSKFREAVNITRNCLVSGTMSMVGETGDDLTPINLTTTFVNCKNQADKTLNGSAQISGTENNAQIVFTNYSVIDGNQTRSMNLTADVQGTDANRTISMNGNITTPEGSVSLTNYRVNINEVATSMTMDGTINITRTPATCADGTYVIETLQPLVGDPATDDIISGQIKINGIVFTFDESGNATATINGEEVTIETSEDLDINCN